MENLNFKTHFVGKDGFVWWIGQIPDEKSWETQIKNGDYEYPITYQIIKDGRKNKVLSKKINSKIIVTMFHGQRDEAVPVSFSRKVLSVFTNAEKRMVVIKNGDHSLSNKLSINKILKELDRFRNSIL